MGSAKAVSNSRNSANKSGEVNWDDFLQNW
jgi:hypothetical protein